MYGHWIHYWFFSSQQSQWSWQSEQPRNERVKSSFVCLSIFTFLLSLPLLDYLGNACNQSSSTEMAPEWYALNEMAKGYWGDDDHGQVLLQIVLGMIMIGRANQPMDDHCNRVAITHWSSSPDSLCWRAEGNLKFRFQLGKKTDEETQNCSLLRTSPREANALHNKSILK